MHLDRRLRARPSLNPTPLDFLVLGLAAWRLSAMLSYERGPFRSFLLLRRAIGIWPASEDDPSPNIWNADNELANVVACVWCLGVWISVALAVAYVLAGSIVTLLAMPFALAAVVVIVEKVAR